jgi:Ricin-type beta-trefoil lectin domain-like
MRRVFGWLATGLLAITIAATTAVTGTASPASAVPDVCATAAGATAAASGDCQTVKLNDFPDPDSCRRAGDAWVKMNDDVKSYVCASEGNRWRLYIVVCKNKKETFINLNSALYLDVVNGSTDDGANIDQWFFTNGENQWWLRLRDPEGYYRLLSSNSFKCLGVLGASNTQGAAAVQWTCNNSTDQQWSFVFTGSYSGNWPIYRVVNRHSGECLGVRSGSSAWGAQVLQWTCNGNSDQSWY